MQKYLVIWLALCSVASAQFSGAPSQDPWDQAVVYRDEWGVPHVYAESTHALAFAFGYAQAEDHLEAMLLAYRRANGRAAEVLGEALAESDELAIRLGHADIARGAYELVDWVTRDLCDGFAQGINAWIIEHPGETPSWAEGVHPADILALMHRYLLSMAPFDYPDAYHLEPGTPSANTWAVAPSLSQSGQSMLVINPHADYNSEFQWYEAHLVMDGVNVYGATLFGIPVIMQGHNEVLGWGLSPNRADIADVYIEKPPAPQQRNPNSVMVARNDNRANRIRMTVDNWRPYFVRDGEQFVERGVQQQRTRRGPIVAWDLGYPLSWKVGGYEDTGAIRQLFDMGRAENLDAFRSAVDRQQLSSFHIVYADQEGNIWYQYNATTGERPDVNLAPSDDGLVLPGGLERSLFEEPLTTQGNYLNWGRNLLPDELPWRQNPDSGYIQASGTPPWLVAGLGRDGPQDWPLWLARDEDSYRAKRVRWLLSRGPRSIRDMHAMLYDTVVPLAGEAVPFLLQAAADHPGWIEDAHPDLIVGLDMLYDWDYLAEPDSMAMTYFHVWWSLMRRDQQDYIISNEAIHAAIQKGTPYFQKRALETAAEAASLLRGEFQSMNVPWGEVHVLRRGRKEIPMAGAMSGDPLFKTRDTSFEKGRWIVDQGYGFAMAVEFGDLPQAASVMPFGNSEITDSPHYDDQLELMRQKRLKLTRFTRTDVESHATEAFGKRIVLRTQGYDCAVFIEAEAAVHAKLTATNRWAGSMLPKMAAFTPYIEPIATPEAIPMQIEIELAVPESVASQDNLSELGLYAYHPVVGWRYVPEQFFDSPRRVFWARVSDAQVYAVLGPDTFLLESPESMRSGQFQVATHTDRAGVSTDRSIVQSPAPTDPADQRLADEEQERVARLFPRNPTISQENRISYSRRPKFDNGLNPLLPALPPGWKLQRDWVPPQPQATTPRRRPPYRPRSEAFTPPLTEIDHGEAPLPTRSSEPLVTDGSIIESTRRPESVSAAITEIPAEADLRPPEPEEEEEVDFKKNRVAFSSKTPKELLGRTGPQSTSFELAPDPSRASPMLIGANLELRPPYEGARFQVTTKASVRAQAILREVPPEPFPSGLVNFAPVFEVMYSPISVLGTTAVVIPVRRGLVAEGRIDSLELYLYDPAFGWVPLPKYKRDAAAQSFTGIDMGMRIYTVLGPADARTR